MSQLPIIGRVSQEVFGRLIVSNSSQFESSVLEGGKVVSSFLLSQGADLAKNAFLFVTDFLVMVFTLFFLFRDGDHFYQTVYAAIPLDPEHKAKIFERMKGTIGAVHAGNIADGPCSRHDRRTDVPGARSSFFHIGCHDVRALSCKLRRKVRRPQGILLGVENTDRRHTTYSDLSTS